MTTSTDPRPLRAHPVADRFPMPDDAVLDDLAADIAEHGQKVPLLVWDDGETRWLLDGRCRLAACERAGVEPVIQLYEGDATLLAFEAEVLSRNMKRRHLPAGVRAAYAVEHLLPRLEAEAKERQGVRTDLAGEPPGKVPQGRARDLAGRAVGVSGRYVSDAKQLAYAAPDLFDEVREGRMALAEATKHREERRTVTFVCERTGEDRAAVTVAPDGTAVCPDCGDRVVVADARRAS